jgi:adenylyltransferase/sulfurtransferase
MIDEPQTPDRWEIDVLDLKSRLDQGEAVRVVDIREPHELALARLEGAEHLPLSEIQSWWHDLDAQEEIVFLCHSGRRSAAVCRALSAEGFIAVRSVTGGIEAWAVRVDPSVPRY